MRVTYKGDYALKAVLDLSINYEHGVTTINDISKRADIPLKFLEQVLLSLKSGGFVESKRGKDGGYFLAQAPSKIKIGDVVRFIDGPTEPIACVDKNYSGCKDLYKCVFRGIWRDVGRSVSRIIDNISFADLVNDIKRDKGSLVYNI